MSSTSTTLPQRTKIVEGVPLSVGPDPGAIGGAGIGTKMIDELFLMMGFKGVLKFCSGSTL